MSIEEIKIYMKKNKISYEKLAEMSGLSVSTVTKIFGGFAKYPRVDTMEAIERALGLGESATSQNSTLADDETELIALYRSLLPEYKELALTNLRTWAGKKPPKIVRKNMA